MTERDDGTLEVARTRYRLRYLLADNSTIDVIADADSYEVRTVLLDYLGTAAFDATVVEADTDEPNEIDLLRRELQDARALNRALTRRRAR